MNYEKIVTFIIAVSAFALLKAFTTGTIAIDFGLIFNFIFDSAWLSPSYTYDFIVKDLFRGFFITNELPSIGNIVAILTCITIYSLIGLIITLPFEILLQFISKKDLQFSVSGLFIGSMALSIAIIGAIVFILLIFVVAPNIIKGIFNA